MAVLHRVYQISDCADYGGDKSRQAMNTDCQAEDFDEDVCQLFGFHKRDCPPIGRFFKSFPAAGSLRKETPLPAPSLLRPHFSASLAWNEYRVVGATEF